MTFSALNADFSSPCPDPLRLRTPAQAGAKDGYSFKKWLFLPILTRLA